MSHYRNERINEEFKRELSSIIRDEVKDPRIPQIISITDVIVSKDLAHAKVYVSMISESKDDTIKALKSASGFIRREISKRIKLRITPDLTFLIDDTIEKGMHIDEIIHSIKEKENGN